MDSKTIGLGLALVLFYLYQKQKVAGEIQTTLSSTTPTDQSAANIIGYDPQTDAPIYGTPPQLTTAVTPTILDGASGVTLGTIAGVLSSTTPTDQSAANIIGYDPQTDAPIYGTPSNGMAKTGAVAGSVLPDPGVSLAPVEFTVPVLFDSTIPASAANINNVDPVPTMGGFALGQLVTTLVPMGSLPAGRQVYIQWIANQGPGAGYTVGLTPQGAGVAPTRVPYWGPYGAGDLR